MTKKIYRNEGFSKRYVGRIDENGNIKIPEGALSEKTVGEVRDDGVYVSAGMFSTKQVIDKTPSGNLHTTEDRGLFSLGTRIGKIDEHGKVYDSDGNLVLTIEDQGSEIKQGVPAEKTSGEVETHPSGVGKKGPEPPGLLPLLLICAPISLGGIWVLTKSLPGLFITDSVSVNGKIGLTVVVAVMCIAEILAALASAQGGLIATATACTAAGSAVGAIAFIISQLMTQEGGWSERANKCAGGRYRFF